MSEQRATLDDLYRTEGPAELIGGKIAPDWLGERPAEVAGNILIGLGRYAKETGRGRAFGGSLGYVARVEKSDRDSFCPDVSYYTGPRGKNPMWFIEGPPDFAAEVRGENDYGPEAEQRRAAKRSDYFDAGCLGRGHDQ